MRLAIVVCDASSIGWIENRISVFLAYDASAGEIHFWGVLLPVVVAVGWCARGLRTLRGTTMTAPCYWALLSLAAMVVAEWLVGRHVEGPSAAAIRYLAATTTLCPVIGLLGAKRPQDRGWQFIVLTLWIVLILPAAQNLAFAPASPLQLHPAWQAFLGLLVLTGLANHLPTRYGLSALLASASQSILLWGQVPGFETTAGRPAVVLAVTGFAIATTLVGLGWPARRGAHALKLRTSTVRSRIRENSEVARPGHLSAEPPNSHEFGYAQLSSAQEGWDRIWLDFRDMFGVVWGLRVAERINDTARRSNWDVRLRWDGFHPDPTTASASGFAAADAAVQIALQNQLRRFVSPDWMEARRPPSR